MSGFACAVGARMLIGEPVGHSEVQQFVGEEMLPGLRELWALWRRDYPFPEQVDIKIEDTGPNYIDLCIIARHNNNKEKNDERSEGH